MEAKEYEVVECECGHVCPVELAHLDADGIYTCPNCVIEELTSQLAEAKPVSSMLPDGFWFYNENGTTVTVVGVIGQWCMVSDPLNSEPYILPLEFVASIYDESNDGNYC